MKVLFFFNLIIYKNYRKKRKKERESRHEKYDEYEGQLEGDFKQIIAMHELNML